MLALEQHAARITTDSGGVQKEAYLLGVPCVTFRDDTEWVETLHDGWNVLAGSDAETITAALAQPTPTAERRNPFGQATPQGASRDHCVIGHSASENRARGCAMSILPTGWPTGSVESVILRLDVRCGD